MDLSYLKEVLLLNKVFLAAATLWGLVLAFVALTKSLQQNCFNLQALAIVGMVVGGIASSLDFLLEVTQDRIYCYDTKPSSKPVVHISRGAPVFKALSLLGMLVGVAFLFWSRSQRTDEKKLFRREVFKVPDEYSGVYWMYSSGTSYFVEPSLDSRDRAFFLLFFEAFVRLLGNLSLFWLFVLATLNPTQWATLCGSDFYLLTWVNVNGGNNPLFWIPFSFTLSRLFLGFSYPDRRMDLREQAVDHSELEQHNLLRSDHESETKSGNVLKPKETGSEAADNDFLDVNEVMLEDAKKELKNQSDHESETTGNVLKTRSKEAAGKKSEELNQGEDKEKEEEVGKAK